MTCLFSKARHCVIILEPIPVIHILVLTEELNHTKNAIYEMLMHKWSTQFIPLQRFGSLSELNAYNFNN